MKLPLERLLENPDPKFEKLVKLLQNELAHLADKELPPGYLLHELSRCGIHLLPVDEDSKLAGI